MCSWQHDSVANVESAGEPTSLEGRREGPYLTTADTGSPLYSMPDDEQTMDALTALRVLTKSLCPGMARALKLPAQMISITPWRLILNLLGMGQTVGHLPDGLQDLLSDNWKERTLTDSLYELTVATANLAAQAMIYGATILSLLRF